MNPADMVPSIRGVIQKVKARSWPHSRSSFKRSTRPGVRIGRGWGGAWVGGEETARSESAKLLRNLVDLVGIEPTTSSMPWKRAPKLRHRPTCCGDATSLFSLFVARFVNWAQVNPGENPYCLVRPLAARVSWGWPKVTYGGSPKVAEPSIASL